ncbi:MAG TPA: Gfo/Idh/MocA family oxidoreductase, partial [Acidobacteriota bacterium]|nr:Gfo/Idh/MocA family oxidoreductase [Acidobacteriota bacterium]
MSNLNRRKFLQVSGIAAFSGIAPYVQTSRRTVFRTALIGCGWWGNNILNVALASGRCKLVGLCDVDRNQIASTRQSLAAVTSETPKAYEDYRELLAGEKPEIVIVATPD